MPAMVRTGFCNIGADTGTIADKYGGIAELGKEESTSLSGTD